VVAVKVGDTRPRPIGFALVICAWATIGERSAIADDSVSAWADRRPVELGPVLETIDARDVAYLPAAQLAAFGSQGVPTLGVAALYGIDFRASVWHPGPLYLGMGLRFAVGFVRDHPVGAVPTEGTPNMINLLNLAGIVGVAEPLSPVARVRVEVAVGVTNATLLFYDCSGNPCGPNTLGLLVEPRILLDLRLARTLSISPFVGDDVAHPSRVSMGVVSIWNWSREDSPL
jgi:hypothetical protein